MTIMKKRLLVCIFLLLAVFIFAHGNKDKSYFEGSGGKGITIAVFEPTGKGLLQSEEYLLSLIQSSITADLDKFSGMTIVDRINLDKILSEQKLSISPLFSDKDYVHIGQLVNARYVVFGSLTRSSNAYILEFAVSNVEKGTREASSSPKQVSFLEIENFSAAKAITSDLLDQLGVKLTSLGKKELTKKASTKQVQAGKAFSKGLVAQKNTTTTVEALSYYQQALQLDPTLVEAASRLNTLSISSGNIGADVRNDIQWRKYWLDRLDECETYVENFMQNPPYILSYTTKFTQGKTDYVKETVDLTMEIYLAPNVAQFEFCSNIINTTNEDLIATQRAETWGITWPSAEGSIFVNNNRVMSVDVEIQDSNGKLLNSLKTTLPYGWKVSYDNKKKIVKIHPMPEIRKSLMFTISASYLQDNLAVNIRKIDGIAKKNISVLMIDTPEYSKNQKLLKKVEKEWKKEQEVEIEKEPKVEIEREPKVEIEREPKVEIEREPKVEIEREPKVEIEREPKVEIEREPKVEIEREPKVEIEKEQKVEIEREQKVEIEKEQKVEIEKERKIENKWKEREKKANEIISTFLEGLE